MPGGVFDDMGFYNLPDGSFYDPDGYLFDCQGYDEFGGHYDSENRYIPGEDNKHLLDDHQNIEETIENDELVKQFEYAEQYDDEEDYIDPLEQKA